MCQSWKQISINETGVELKFLLKIFAIMRINFSMPLFFNQNHNSFINPFIFKINYVKLPQNDDTCTDFFY